PSVGSGMTRLPLACCVQQRDVSPPLRTDGNLLEPWRSPKASPPLSLLAGSLTRVSSRPFPLSKIGIICFIGLVSLHQCAAHQPCDERAYQLNRQFLRRYLLILYGVDSNKLPPQAHHASTAR